MAGRAGGEECGTHHQDGDVEDGVGAAGAGLGTGPEDGGPAGAGGQAGAVGEG